MKQYRVGIVGCGRMGGTIDDEVTQEDQWWQYRPVSHAAAYQAVEETTLTALADSDARKLEHFAQRYNIPDGHCYTDFRQMIDHEAPDIVSVTTPAGGHAPITVYAAQHGVSGIFCEKAMACSMDEADAMLEACRANNVAFNLGTSRRYHPGMRTMREVIRSGRIGAPDLLVHKGWLGLLLHSGSHTFDTMLYLLGDPELKSVQGQLRSQTHKDGTVSAPRYDPEANRFLGQDAFESDPGIDFVTVLFKGGVRAHLVRLQPCYEFEVFGSEGSVGFNHYNKGWIRPSIKDGAIERMPFPEFRPESFTKCMIRDLIESIEAGSLGHLEASHRGMEVSMALAQSHIEGRRLVEIPMTNRSLCVPNY